MSARRAPRPARAPAASGTRRAYWLLKTEPGTFSFDDLWRAPRRRTGWDGVRNHQARNFLRDTMRDGDLALVYHSSADPSGVAGLARIVGEATPDPTQFDARDEHHDPKSRREAPTWWQVTVQALARCPRFVPLEALRKDPRLSTMLVLRRGQRLSVQPVTPAEFAVVLELAGLDPASLGR